jgi:hypothetical protein
MIQLKNNFKKKKEKTRTIKGIPGKVAKFDQKLFDKYDIEGRKLIKNILKDDIDDNPDIYGEDMIFNIKPFPYKYIEVQSYAMWDSDKFPYCNPFVYARKMRFSKRTLFIAFNRYFSELIMFGRKSISDIPSRLKKYDREFVNFVPWKNSLRIKTCDLSINMIREYYGEIIDDAIDNVIDNTIDNVINDVII